MTSVNPRRPDHAMALLADVTGAFQRDLLDEVVGTELPTHMEDLRGSQIRLLQLVPPEGLRATDLAHRAGITKQALGELAATLAATGHLESVRDPSDGRVRIWRRTATGDDAAAWGERLIGAVERRWRRRVGASEWDELRRTLARVRDLVEDTGP